MIQTYALGRITGSLTVNFASQENLAYHGSELACQSMGPRFWQSHWPGKNGANDGHWGAV